MAPRRNWYMGISVFGAMNAHLERERRRDLRALADVVDALLAADQFQFEKMPWLADRKRFADTARAFRRELRGDPHCFPDPLIVLLEPFTSRVRAFRMAREFGAISPAQAKKRKLYFEIDDLRNLNSDRAREALAALAECDWPTASRRERSAYCIHRIAQIQLGRS